MSEHRTGLSNWTAEDKKLYWQRHTKRLRGQLGVVAVHQTVKDEKGKEQLVPLGDTVGATGSARLSAKGSSKRTNPHYTQAGAWRKRALAAGSRERRIRCQGQKLAAN